MRQSVSKRSYNKTFLSVILEKGQTLADLYQQRVPLYEKYADVTICCDECTVEDVVEKIEIQQHRFFYPMKIPIASTVNNLLQGSLLPLLN